MELETISKLINLLLWPKYVNITEDSICAIQYKPLIYHVMSQHMSHIINKWIRWKTHKLHNWRPKSRMHSKNITINVLIQVLWNTQIQLCFGFHSCIYLTTDFSVYFDCTTLTHCLTHIHTRLTSIKHTQNSFSWNK